MFNPATESARRIGAVSGVGQNPVGIAISPDDTKLYVANTTSNTVSVITLR